MLPNDLDNRDNSISSEDEDIPEEKITKVGISTYREDTCMHYPLMTNLICTIFSFSGN